MDTYRVSGPAKGLLALSRPEEPRNGFEVHVACFVRGFMRTTDFTNEADRRDVDLYVLRERFLGDPRLLGRLASIVRWGDFDILQTHGHKANVLGALLRGRIGIPWVAFAHGWTDENSKIRLYNRLDAWAMRSADRVATVSERWTHILRGYGIPRSKLRVIPNAVALAPSLNGEPCALREQLGIERDTPLVLVVGRLSPEKGHAVFLDAVARLKADGSDFRAVFVGEGQERERLALQTRELGLEDRVVFAGYHADVAPFYGAADLVVLPSLSENMPNVALEAMSFGKPVVATRVGGVPEVVVDEQTGRVVPSNDPNALAEGIGQVLRAPERARSLGRAGRTRAVAEFSPQRRHERFQALYAEVLDRKN